MKRPADLRTLAVNWVAATAFVSAWMGLAALADRDDSAARQLSAQEAQALALEARMVQGAAALCVADLGPGARPGFTPDGSLVCLLPPAGETSTPSQAHPTATTVAAAGGLQP